MAQRSPIRVMSVDNETVIHSGLKAFLRAYEDIQLLVDAADGEEAVRLCTHYRPDIMLTEITLPRMNGITATRIIRTRYPQIRTVIFTNTVNETLLHEALTAGATGYLLKSASPEELAKAIRNVYNGDTSIAHEVTQCLLRVAINYAPPIGSDLTSREREILRLLAVGMNNRAIAQALTVSHSTVKFHVSNILAKMQAKTRMQALSLALRHNLVAQTG